MDQIHITQGWYIEQKASHTVELKAIDFVMEHSMKPLMSKSHLEGEIGTPKIDVFFGKSPKGRGPYGLTGYAIKMSKSLKK